MYLTQKVLWIVRPGSVDEGISVCPKARAASNVDTHYQERRIPDSASSMARPSHHPLSQSARIRCTLRSRRGRGVREWDSCDRRHVPNELQTGTACWSYETIRCIITRTTSNISTSKQPREQTIQERNRLDSEWWKLMTSLRQSPR